MTTPSAPRDRVRPSVALGPLVARLAPYAVSAVVVLAVALVLYQPWALGDAMVATAGDAPAFHAWVQATVEDGWYETASRLSAPYAMDSRSYPVTDDLVFLVVGKVLAPLAGSAAGGVTLWVVLGFPLAAVAAVAAARYLGVGRLAALVPGVAFPLLPDHFFRAQVHHSLTASWAVPLGLLLGLTLVRAPRPTGVDGRTGWRRHLLTAGILLGGVAIALTNAYYATFAAMLVAVCGVAAVAGAVEPRARLRLVGATLARLAALIGPVVLAIAMDLASAPHPLGYPAFDVTRSPADAETFGGKVVAMLLPSTSHRLGPLADLRREYDAAFPDPAESPALGLVAGAGFVALVAWSVITHLRARSPGRDDRLHLLAGLTWVGLLAYVVGGLGTVWALVLDGGGIRVWSRVHVVLALLALLAVAVAVDRLRGRRPRAQVVVLILAVALVDQVPATGSAAPAVTLRDELVGFTSAVADEAGDDAMVFQLPATTFPIPRGPVGAAGHYDGFLPYLHSTGTGLRWSYGGLQGDPTSDWQLGVVQRQPDEFLPLLAASGFAGVVLDTHALVLRPELAREVEDVLSEPTVVSTSGRWSYLPLDRVLPDCSAEVLDELRDLLVAPALAYPGDGIALQGGVLTADGDATLQVLTLRDQGWSEVEVTVELSNPATPVRVTLPDGEVRDLPGGGSTLTWTGDVAATGGVVRIERTGGDDGLPLTVRELTARTPPSPAAVACLPSLGPGTAVDVTPPAPPA